MKAKELMVGDWIQALCENYEPYEVVLEKSQITHINRETIYVANGNIFYGEDGEMRRYSVAEPIKLTEGILEKNGWTIKKRFVQYGNFGKNPPLMLWNTETNEVLRHAKNELEILDLSKAIGTYHIRLQCMFVHELQHALRLCGLNELADNFKVE